MILNDFLGDSNRIDILESFLDNEGYSLTLDDVKHISEVSNPLPDLNSLIKIGILSERNGEYELNLKDKRVIYLSLINNEEYSRKLKEMDKTGIFNEVKTFPSDIYSKIYQLTKKYNLGSISIENDEVYSYIYIIKVPQKLDYKKILQLWDKILDDVKEFCKQKEYESYYKNIQIVLRR